MIASKIHVQESRESQEGAERQELAHICQTHPLEGTCNSACRALCGKPLGPEWSFAPSGMAIDHDCCVVCAEIDCDRNS